MPIWNVASVTAQPELTLVDWKILETQRGERHFVGYVIENQEGRVSSAIEQFDPVSLRGVTRSGRVYRLYGAPGFNRDAEYVWKRWVQLNAITEYLDVTDAVLGVE